MTKRLKYTKDILTHMLNNNNNGGNNNKMSTATASTNGGMSMGGTGSNIGGS